MVQEHTLPRSGKYVCCIIKMSWQQTIQRFLKNAPAFRCILEILSPWFAEYSNENLLLLNFLSLPTPCTYLKDGTASFFKYFFPEALGHAIIMSDSALPTSVKSTYLDVEGIEPKRATSKHHKPTLYAWHHGLSGSSVKLNSCYIIGVTVNLSKFRLFGCMGYNNNHVCHYS